MEASKSQLVADPEVHFNLPQTMRYVTSSIIVFACWRLSFVVCLRTNGSKRNLASKFLC